ncbi:MAG: peptide-methionine (S)-S-oxide reductase MsrA [Planctomycetota bacterium]
MRVIHLSVLLLAALACLSGCSQNQGVQSGSGVAREGSRTEEQDTTRQTMNDQGDKTTVAQPSADGTETATFGAGCYWCTEAVLETLDGVLDVRSGFMGGTVANPSYELVCSGSTGHAEVVQVRFDPKKIAYATLLEWFWKLHDPTTLNQQGYDIGTQYRSVIFFHSAEQKRVAEDSRAKAQAQFQDRIVTEITPAGAFYEADAHHQDFYRNNPNQGYCRAVIRPKLKKLGIDK